MRSTPTAPTYEGRRLPRPDDEVVDQGLAFDLGTLMGRRRMLRTLGLGVAGLGLAACGSTTTSSTSSATSGATSGSGTTGSEITGSEIPDETAGPYPGDGSNGPDVLSESGVVRSDLRSSFGSSSGTAEGVPMILRLAIKDLARGGVPFAGVAVYVWQCNAAGEYSMYSAGVTDQNYLRGVQIADADGVVTFTSIVPACYSGRWPHIHFEVYPDASGFADADPIATSQVALPKDLCDAVYATAGYEQSVGNLAEVTLQSDNVFGDDGGALQLGSATGDVTRGYAVSLTVGVDTTTTPAAGSAPGGGGRGGTPPSGRGGQPSGAPGAGATSGTTA